MAWFQKVREGLKWDTRREFPDGLWVKCADCGQIIYRAELERNLWVCNQCLYHFRVPSETYIEILLDDGIFEEMDANLVSADPLKFKDSEAYPDRIAKAIKKTGSNDAVRVGSGRIGGQLVSFGVMNFAFIGGSMGSVVGEKISRSIERSIKGRVPLVLVSASGGARMQEGILSLMQMAKTSLLLGKLHEEKIPFISILTHPTTAGVMASFASLGDVIIAEPKAQLGFAGPRVIQQTIGQELPPGFQRSEFFMEHGFLDMIVDRRKLQEVVASLLRYFTPESA